jgi:predicted LPLAT superfamily acyltransferase
MAVSPPAQPPRNPGPSWGYRFLRTADCVLPEWIYRPLRAFGTLIALANMPEQRRHSRAYLETVLGRRARFREVFRHFFTFEEALMTKLRVINGRPHRTVYAPGSDDFRAWLERGGPVLLGTFHFGVSDLQGCQIGGYGHQDVYVVRLRVGNSHDTDALSARFGSRLKFVWINEPSELLFALKNAAATSAAIAMQCDRVEFSARTEAFEFLGARRLFPFTIYHLALIFGRPVLFAVGVPEGPELATLHTSPRFDPLPGEAREVALARARAHFQLFLNKVEVLLRANPYLWFNFTPLNPLAPPTDAAQPGSGA